uniref:Variant surface glycoprotein 1125.4215 n=1 Tax=Trypanosoma brucei TaxID=5691 RepID=M4T068_9TRYP|nr:variant surface glycoprotein 500 [Trypanosoma brucei]APD74742.1 variant surface glycoprotein 1125.4215 [Trypanosoma brucei]
MRNLFFAVAILLTSLAKTEASGDDPAVDANSKVTDFCSMMAYYSALKNVLQQWITTATVRENDLAEEAKLLTLAAAKSQHTSSGPAYQLLAQLALQRTSAAAAEIAKQTPKIQAAIAALTTKKGELANLHADDASITAGLTLKTTGATNGGSALSGGSNKQCKVEVKRSIVPAATCEDTDGRLTAAKTISTLFTKARSIKTVAASTLKARDLQVTLEAKGNIDTGSGWKVTTDNKACEDNAAGGPAASANVGVALTGLQATGTLTYSTLDLTSDAKHGSKDNNGQQSNKVTYHISDAELTQALRAAQQAKPALPAQVKTETVESASDTAAAKKLAAAISRPGTKTAKGEAETAEIAMLIFKKKSGSIETDFLTPLTKDKLSIPTDGEPITGSTQQLATNNFDAAMAYYYALNLKKAATAAEVKPNTDTQPAAGEDKTEEKKGGDKKDEVCTGTEEGICDKKKCDWNAEKKQCKVKEGAAVISAVIKAPHLLAAVFLS